MNKVLEELKQAIPVLKDVAYALIIVVGTVLGSQEITGQANDLSVEIQQGAELILNGLAVVVSVGYVVYKAVKRSGNSALPVELVEKLKELGLL